MTGLDERQRKSLESAVGRMRSLLETDLAARLEGRFGIYEDGRVDAESALRLDPSAIQDRRDLVGIVDYLQADGESPPDAVRRLVREATFTHLNRLVAIRIAEAIGLLPAALSQGRESQGYRDVLEIAPLLADDDTGGYWTYLKLCGDELAADAPNLFDPRNPLLALAPSPKALDQLISLLADASLRDAWPAPDTLGWTYQFFNTGDERRQMRAESGAPRNGRELAVRNQFFTPRYVVDFLVQNTLGRRLMEADPTSTLLEHLPLLVDPPTAPGAPLSLADIKILDPAVGSAHFLLGCYDLLETAWQLAGVPPADAAPFSSPASGASTSIRAAPRSPLPPSSSAPAATSPPATSPRLTSSPPAPSPKAPPSGTASSPTYPPTASNSLSACKRHWRRRPSLARYSKSRTISPRPSRKPYPRPIGLCPCSIKQARPPTSSPESRPTSWLPSSASPTRRPQLLQNDSSPPTRATRSASWKPCGSVTT